MQPVLCQTAQRDGHTTWHEPSFNNIRELWFKNKEASNKKLQASDEPKRGLGRPKGSKIRRKFLCFIVNSLSCSRCTFTCVHHCITVICRHMFHSVSQKERLLLVVCHHWNPKL